MGGAPQGLSRREPQEGRHQEGVGEGEPKWQWTRMPGALSSCYHTAPNGAVLGRVQSRVRRLHPAGDCSLDETASQKVSGAAHAPPPS